MTKCYSSYLFACVFDVYGACYMVDIAGADDLESITLFVIHTSWCIVHVCCLLLPHAYIYSSPNT